MKKADQAKPYDPKGSVWIMDQKTHGYKEGILEVGNINLEDPNEKCVVACGHEKFNLKAASRWATSTSKTPTRSAWWPAVMRSLTSRQPTWAVSIRPSSRSAWWPAVMRSLTSRQ